MELQDRDGRILKLATMSDRRRRAQSQILAGASEETNNKNRNTSEGWFAPVWDHISSDLIDYYQSTKDTWKLLDQM